VEVSHESGEKIMYWARGCPRLLVSTEVREKDWPVNEPFGIAQIGREPARQFSCRHLGGGAERAWFSTKGIW
jgi:hypothetical protein